ncbi:MAG: MotA/TolQ/ExbB proton channel family protein [Planctomycetes bacterium]|nr:MotA/TolQ/ExbB proton channel family protein [Planctomycetota bacterium]MCW8134773.1 MotA/TolQ/ExbB proton channel family protein [Planctomycetota bacterium]
MNVKITKQAFYGVLIFAVAAVLAPALFAQEGGYSLGEKILGIPSGAFGILTQLIIILTSVFMFGWIIECFVNVRRDKIVPPEVIGALQNYIDEGDLEGALQYCESAPNYLTRIVGAGLNRMQYGPESVKDAAIAMADAEQGKVEFHISPIALCASVGPLMGLFGTVTGMVQAFEQIENAPGGQVNPKMVAGGISLALLSTVCGLIIAIPGLSFFWFFKNKVQSIGTSITLVADDMVETIAAYAGQQ